MSVIVAWLEKPHKSVAVISNDLLFTKVDIFSIGKDNLCQRSMFTI